MAGQRVGTVGAVNYVQRSDKAVCVCCPLCASKDISVAAESVIADSYHCANCRAYFAVSAAYPPPTYTLTTTTDPGATTAQRCPVCNGTGGSGRWRFTDPQSPAAGGWRTCHGCGGRGWVTT